MSTVDWTAAVVRCEDGHELDDDADEETIEDALMWGCPECGAKVEEVSVDRMQELLEVARELGERSLLVKQRRPAMVEQVDALVAEAVDQMEKILKRRAK